MFMETNALSRSNYPIDYDPAHRNLKTNKWLKTCILLSSFTFAREKLFIFSAMIAVLQEIFLGKQEVGRTLSLTSPKPGIVLYSSPPKPGSVLYSYLIQARYCPLFLPHPGQVLSFILTSPKPGIVLYSYPTQARYCPLFLLYPSKVLSSILTLPKPGCMLSGFTLPKLQQRISSFTSLSPGNSSECIFSNQNSPKPGNHSKYMFFILTSPIPGNNKFLWLIIIRLKSRLYINYWF